MSVVPKRVVVTGMLASFPVGGVAWDYGHYLLGLEELGFEVYYLEDTGSPTYDPTRMQYGDDPSYGVRFLRESLAALSPTLADRWHFRAGDGRTFGMDPQRLHQLIAEADLLLNVSGGTLLRDEYMACPCKVLIDTDPGWNQFVNYRDWDRKYPRRDQQHGWQGTYGYRAHDHFFTYAERIGRSDCLIPEMGLTWHPTRPPVTIDRWQAQGAGQAWTTVMSWNTYRKPIQYQGRVFGAKEREFTKIETLPVQSAGVEFELAAVGHGQVRADRWRHLGWQVIDSHAVSTTMDDYRDYIERSRGELSVAKNVYVDTRSGWFSCRSACYLAAGRPVIVQDTGFSEIVPTGEGLFAFSDSSQAEAAVTAAESNYERHQHAARDVAAAYFAPQHVLRELLERVGLK